MRDVRSPDVGAEKAPPVRPSSGCASDLGVVLATGAGAGAGLDDLNMWSAYRWLLAGCVKVRNESAFKNAKRVFSLIYGWLSKCLFVGANLQPKRAGIFRLYLIFIEK